jgi:transposase-like protein
VTEVAGACGVPRQSVHAWIRRYAEGGLAGPERLPSAEPVTRTDALPQATGAKGAVRSPSVTLGNQG